MNRGVRATLIMFVVLAGLAAFVVYTNNAEQAAATSEPSLYIWDLTTADVAQVQIVDNAQQTAVTLRRDATDGWRVASRRTADGSQVLPEQPADPSQGDFAASMVSTLFVQRILTETTEIGEFGLLDPAYSLKVEQADGAELSLDVGLKTPPEDGYYVLKPGDQHAIIVNAGSIDPLLQFLAQPPVAVTPTPEADGTGTPAANASATVEP
jgi:hypothetical protein